MSKNNIIKKYCSHKYECGCNKNLCEECDSDWEMCENEDCRNYYNFRNDNCNCMSRDCPYCEEKRINK